jgi:hypothetical protein
MVKKKAPRFAPGGWSQWQLRAAPSGQVRLQDIVPLVATVTVAAVAPVLVELRQFRPFTVPFQLRE